MIPSLRSSAMPLVSICLPTLNRARLLERALRTALAQTYANIEVVLCDNASSDETPALAARFANDPRVRYVRNESTIPMTANFNRSAAASTGEYLVFLSDDDALSQHHVETLLSRVRQSHDPVELAYGMAVHADSAHTPYRLRRVLGESDTAHSGRDDYRHLMRACVMCLPTMLIARSIFERVGGFDERFTGADWRFALEIAALDIRCAYVPQVVVTVGVHDDQLSGAAFATSGREATERLVILETALDERFHDRFHGAEHAIAADLARLVATLPADMPPEIRDASLERAERIRQTLASFAVRVPPVRADRPAVSVIVRASGRGYAFRYAIASLQAQTMSNWEAIIVEEMHPSLLPVMQDVASDRRVRSVHYDQVRYAGAARNCAIDIARGPIAVFLDDDDELPPDFMERIVRHFAEDDVDAVICASVFVAGGYTLRQDGAGGRYERYDDVIARGIGRCGPRTTAAFDDVPLTACAVRIASLDRLTAIRPMFGSRRFAPFVDDRELFSEAEFIAQIERALHVVYDAATSVVVRRTGDVIDREFFRHEPRPTAQQMNGLAYWLDRYYQSIEPRSTTEAEERGLHRSVLTGLAAATSGEPTSPRRSIEIAALLAGRYTVIDGRVGLTTTLSPISPREAVFA